MSRITPRINFTLSLSSLCYTGRRSYRAAHKSKFHTRSLRPFLDKNRLVL
jgi:hypothetical protein